MGSHQKRDLQPHRSMIIGEKNIVLVDIDDNGNPLEDLIADTDNEKDSESEIEIESESESETEGGSTGGRRSERRRSGGRR